MGFLKDFLSPDYNNQSKGKRWEYVGRITSDFLLDWIFERSNYSDTRLNALSRIRDEYRLKAICTNSTDLAVKTVALSGLGESAGLAVWRSPENKGSEASDVSPDEITVDFDDMELVMDLFSEDFARKCALQMCPDLEIVRGFLKKGYASDEMIMNLREIVKDDDLLCSMALEHWYFGIFFGHLECFKDNKSVFDSLLDRAEQVMLTERNWRVFSEYKMALDDLGEEERATRSRFWAKMIHSIEADLARTKDENLQEHFDLMVRYINHFISDAALEELVGTLQEDYVIDQIQAYRENERERLAVFERAETVFGFNREWDTAVSPEDIEKMRRQNLRYSRPPPLESERVASERVFDVEEGGAQAEEPPDRVIEVHVSSTYSLPDASGLRDVLPSISDDLLSVDFDTGEFVRGSFGPGEEVFWNAVDTARSGDDASAVAQFEEAIEAGLTGVLLATAHGNCGQLSVELGRLFEAVDAFRNCLAVTPKEADTAWEAASRLSYVYEAAGRSADAIALQALAEKANSALSVPLMHPAEEIMRYGELAREFAGQVRDGRRVPSR